MDYPYTANWSTMLTPGEILEKIRKLKSGQGFGCSFVEGVHFCNCYPQLIDGLKFVGIWCLTNQTRTKFRFEKAVPRLEPSIPPITQNQEL